jgi:protein involved in polysaccharide export with SLBB domain
MRSKIGLGIVAGSWLLWAQDPSALLDPQAIRQSLAQAGTSLQAPDATPKSTLVMKSEQNSEQKAERERLEQKVASARARERGPRRFASDLFETRQSMSTTTEGGVAEDYVLGVGDQLQATAVGSANFEIPLQVNGRGEVVVPRVGAVHVSGKSLAGAKALIEAKVARNFSNTRVDLSVVKLREVRVFVLGEVYVPGSYLVPSLSSLVNVLGLAGGPTPAGSFRQIRVMRGGQVVHTLDLYPLRAEGLGNMNFSLQSGDTIFVPLAFNQVLLEGAFTRVAADAEASAQPRNGEGKEEPEDAKPEAQRTLQRQIQRLEARLGAAPAAENRGAGNKATMPLAAGEAGPVERVAIEEELQRLRDQLQELRLKGRGDQRVPEQEAVVLERLDQPRWLTRWQLEGKAPRMQFEALPGESAADLLRFAGGFTAQAFQQRLSLRRMDASGATQVLDIPVPEGAASTALQRGDVLSALPLRDRQERSVQVQGWARVPGVFARVEGLRVGDLLNRENQILPDTYLGRGEIVRTALDGRTSYLAFDVAKAMTGDPVHNLLIEDRDRVELYRLDDLRLRRTVKVMGPVTRPGTFDFHDGMRAADLLFRAGVPLRSADRFVAELAHTREGKPSEVRTLDLARLLSTEQTSPVDLRDDAVNPRLEPFDQLSLFEKPDYRPHRVVKIAGQVARPGSYSIDRDAMGLADLLARAGGLTSDAMPEGMVFLRRLGNADPEKLQALEAAGAEIADPTGNGINDILNRLSETKRQPLTGALLKTPVLHGISVGTLNRMVVNLSAVLKGDRLADVNLQDGDEIVIPRKTDAAYVVGETASPFATFRVREGMKVRELLALAGGTTRNADTWNIRLLKADGRILDSWVSGRRVEPGDAVLVPPKVKRDVAWQENLAAFANLAVIYAAIKK